MIGIAAGLAFGTSGCMWGRLQVNDPEIVVRAKAIRPGITNVDQLRGILQAEPTLRLPGKGSTLLGYTYADTKSNGLVLIVVNFSKTQTVAETLYVEVDSETGLVRRTYVPGKRELEWEWNPFDGE